jgi:hypothetical protein
MSEKKRNKLHQILRNLTVELKSGDQIMVWHDGYQVHFDKVGTSNFKVKTKTKTSDLT